VLNPDPPPPPDPAAPFGVAPYTWTEATWTDSPDNEKATVAAIAYGNGKYVAVGNMAFTSTDGKTWTVTDSFKNFENMNLPSTPHPHMVTIYFADGKFWAGGREFKFGLSNSTDGVTWTNVQDESVRMFFANLAYGGGKFVALDNNGYISYSSNGTTWLNDVVNVTPGQYPLGLAYGNNMFLVGGGIDYQSATKTGTPYMARSTNGKNWTTVNVSTALKGASIYSIAWGGDRFVAVGGGGKMAWSKDGLTWTAITKSTVTNPALHLEQVAYGDNIFIAVGGETGGSGKVNYYNPAVKANEVFAAEQIDELGTLSSVFYGNGTFFIVGGNQIFYSTKK
jgi:hypothetical protein